MEKVKIIDTQVSITKNDRINEHFYILGVSKPDAFDAFAGQFVNIQIEPDSLNPLLRRPFSIFYLDKYEIGILYQVKGSGTKILSTKKVGSTLKLLGPLGNHFPELKKSGDDIAVYYKKESISNNISCIEMKKLKKAVFIAGGVGIAPLIYYAKKIKELDFNIQNILIHGCKNNQYFLLEDYTKYLFDIKFFSQEVELENSFNSSLSGKDFIYDGNVIDLLNNNNVEKYIHDDDRKTLYLVCGPDPMIKAFIKWNLNYGYDAYLSLESFMGCGFNVCLGCAIPRSDGGFLYVCKDGPIVHYTTIRL